MKKILIIVGLLIVASAVALFYFTDTFEKKEAANIQDEVNEYPNMNLIMTDGSFRTARELPERSILILYFPDCDHCQRQAVEIESHLKAFENYHLWFISIAPYEDIEKFAKGYKLTGHANIHFVRTEMQDVINNFGTISAPSIYVFSKERKLVKAFNGETKIEEIVSHL